MTWARASSHTRFPRVNSIRDLGSSVTGLLATWIANITAGNPHETVTYAIALTIGILTIVDRAIAIGQKLIKGRRARRSESDA